MLNYINLLKYPLDWINNIIFIYLYKFRKIRRKTADLELGKIE